MEYEKFLIVKKKFNALEKRFKELSASMPDAVIVIDNNFITEWFNKSATNMFSLKDNDIGRPILHLIRNPNFTKFINSNKRISFVKFISPLKYDITLQSFIVPYGEDKYLLTFRDVSEADHLDKMRRDFIANVSHELKTPLTVIFGYLESINTLDKKNIDDNIIFQMLKQAKRMDVMISDLLKLTQLQATSIPEKNFSPINLKNLINELLLATKSDVEKNNNKISVLNDSDVYIRGSYEEIYSVFLNLLSNAIMYSGNGVLIEINYMVNDKKETILSVQDYGVGIPKDSVGRLTERFYRVDKGRSREQGGTGLGLSIVKHIMNRHDGKLIINSSIGEGSKFSCIFPKSLFTLNLSESSGNV
ncbi:MAG: phosphate regulon sensor histidine kinase PhoR [Gammaproteobacteria bacterium]|nr:phosphate regulon sensor histidine kinase PhoR [Gammaproteobacteria bacterium]